MRVVHRIRWSLKQRGLVGTLISAAKSLGRKLRPPASRAPHPFDLQNGVDTDGVIAGHNLAIGHANDRFIAGYAAIPPSRFRGAIKKWQVSSPPHAIEECTFIDFGCGKGRAILLASELGFREVVGVELNPNLAAIAQANAEVWTASGKAKCPVRIVCGDALDLEWPEGPCLAYLYNPFGEQVMRRLAKNMKAHFSCRPGDLEVIYQKPEQAALFTEDFEMVWCQAIPMSEDDMQAELVADPKDESRAYRLAKPTP